MGKPTSLVAEMGLVTATVAAALRGGADTASAAGAGGGVSIPLPELAWGGLSGLAQVQTCHVGSRPTPGREPRLSPEKARAQRVAGGCPPPPVLGGPLVSTRSFWRGGAQRDGRWAITVPLYVP